MPLRHISRGRRRAIAALRSSLALALVAAPAVVAAPAHAATGDQPAPIPVQSECVTGWYVNPDEGNRLPEQTEDGFFFQPADLAHHAADIALADLGDGGTYLADPAPDSNFRFSVEIINQTPIDGKSGYATLHWDGLAWFIGGADASQGQYEGHEANAADLIGKVGRFGQIGQDSQVISFGIGYTQTPPGTVETTVSSVTFDEETYDLTCSPTPAETETSAPPAAPALATTGTNLGWLIYAAAGLVVLGAVIALLARRRRPTA